MSSGLVDYLKKNTEYKNKYFYRRKKYRTTSCDFKKLYKSSEKFAALLRNYNIKKGDKVIIKGQNSPEWIMAFMGCLIRGAVAVPVDINSGPEFEKKVISEVKPKLIVRGEGEIDKSSGIKSVNIGDIEGIISDLEPVEDMGEKISSHDIAEIIFTSGTTTRPKGVMITHGNIESNLESIQPVMEKWKKFFRFMRGLKILSVVPLSHMYGQLIGIFVPFMIRSSVVFMDSVSPPEIIKAIKEEKIWILGALPKILELIKDYMIKKFNLESEKFKKKYDRFKKIKWPVRFTAFLNIHFKIGWRFIAIVVGGASFDKDIDQFWRCLAYTIFQGYGLTETAPLITLADPTRTGAGSIGEALKGLEVRLVNGEIYVKGSNVTPGYYKNYSLTKKSFSKGWFKTGDLAEMDEKGNIFFKGRKDSAIVREDGINIYPEDIESVLKTFDSVRDSMVLGLKEDGSLRIHAVLILEDNFRGEAREIIDKANKKLNVYQRINSWSVWEGDDFPRTSTGKIKRDKVSEALSEGKDKTVVAGGRHAGGRETLTEVLKSLKKVRLEDLRGDSELERDLGLDSLDIAQLSGIIEDKYNVEVDDSYIGRNTKVSELEKMIEFPPEKSKRKIPYYKFPFWLPVRILRAVFQFVLYPFTFLVYRLRAGGRIKLKNLKKPVVFAANHTSILDSFVILYSLPFNIRRKVVVLMSIEYHFKNFFYHTGPWWRRIAEAAGFYLLVNLFVNVSPLSRTYGFKNIMENAGRMIDGGWHILIYPEGRVTDDGDIKGFESGIGVMALDMEVPVVPVRVKGLFNILRNGVIPWGHLPGRPLVEVKFGRPMEFKKSEYNEYRKAASIIENKVKEL
ncbi:MAG: AMP-binding protein [Actinomycetota bacterium]|nr:AMP-binding protein [Actinomycetota bacterium]